MTSAENYNEKKGVDFKCATSYCEAWNSYGESTYCDSIYSAKRIDYSKNVCIKAKILLVEGF